MPDASRVLVMAPNWLGDAVMALPAIDDVSRRFAGARLTVAARGGAGDVFRLVERVDDVVTLSWKGRWWHARTIAEDVARLRAVQADVALLLPNSFASAWLVTRAGVPERWGYRTDMRGPLLTRTVAPPFSSLHQGAYYQRLTRELGFDSGPLEPAVTVTQEIFTAAHDFLTARGWDGRRPLVVFAPGAAYGAAKRWLPAHVAQAATDIIRDAGATGVMVGGPNDAATVAQVRARMAAGAREHAIDVAGQTSIERLAGVLHLAAACVSNDSGAMHLAAAVGTPLVATFGPTNEYETRPLTRHGRVGVVLTHPVWCRPCMLRECPIDHRCMKGITPRRVYDAVMPLVANA